MVHIILIWLSFRAIRHRQIVLYYVYRWQYAKMIGKGSSGIRTVRNKINEQERSQCVEKRGVEKWGSLVQGYSRWWSVGRIYLNRGNTLIYYMSSSRTTDKTSRHKAAQGETPAEKQETQMIAQTPVKRAPVPGASFYSTLSPLPLPPKIDLPNAESYGSYSKELMYVETPVAKEHFKSPIHEDQAIHYTGIVNKIIFESSGQEDLHNNSSSLESSEPSSEQELSQEPLRLEDEEHQPSAQESHKMNQSESVSGTGKSDPQHQGRPKKISKRSSVQPKEVSNPNKKVFCNCKKTKCLKLYCDCFRLNQTCQGCNCVGCHNLEIYSDQRNNAILALMDRNPDPFGQKIEDDKHVKGCNCKKSGCLKKYCECYQAGLKCGENCKCEDCKNMVCEKTPETEPQRGASLNRLTAKKERRMLEI